LRKRLRRVCNAALNGAGVFEGLWHPVCSTEGNNLGSVNRLMGNVFPVCEHRSCHPSYEPETYLSRLLIVLN
jgi:hypothetical protein